MSSKKDQNLWKKSVWQYLIDHAKPTKTGYYVSFYTTDPNSFWHRVNARRTGRFTRNDMNEFQDEQRKVFDEYNTLKRIEYKRSKTKRKENRIIKNGRIYQKCTLRLARLLYYIADIINPAK